MSPRKLSEADKNEILRLYRHSPETTSTLASLYSVSSSTISRFLKSNLPEIEYETLIQQKRAQAIATPIESAIESPLSDTASAIASIPVTEPIKSKTLAVQTPPIEIHAFETPSPRQLEIVPTISAIEPPVIESSDISPNLPKKVQKVLPNLPITNQPISGTASLEIEAETAGEEGLDDDFDDDWEDEETDDDDEDDVLNLVPRRANLSKATEIVDILPLSAANLPKVCYLVVDRSAELVACPLRDFSDLGNIPESEVQEKTLPVFPNHRVATRFSNRSQKVIKVPDSGILQKTSLQLQAKGITRLLVNGQVYSIGDFTQDE
jgi:hypothetical protein